MKKFLSFALLIVLILSLFGCSPNNNPNKVAEEFVTSLIDGDTEQFLNCFYKEDIDKMLDEQGVEYDVFKENLEKELKRSKERFKERGYTKENFKIHESQYKSKSKLDIKVEFNGDSVKIPLKKYDDGKWYIDSNILLNM